MHLNMLIQIGLLRKVEMTSKLLLKWATEGLFFGVNPQVIVEIVPLPEVHEATVVFAFQYLHKPLRLRIFILVDLIVLAGGHVVIRVLLGDLEHVEVHTDLESIDNFHGFALFWNLIPDGCVVYVASLDVLVL